MLKDEVNFLCEHYHSVHPVVFASPSFFLINYIMFPIVVWAICFFTIILCSNGDVLYAFHSFREDNYAVSVGIMKLTRCILIKIAGSPADLFAVINVSITILLVLAFVYEEVWEFIVFLLSNRLILGVAALQIHLQTRVEHQPAYQRSHPPHSVGATRSEPSRCLLEAILRVVALLGVMNR